MAVSPMWDAAHGGVPSLPLVFDPPHETTTTERTEMSNFVTLDPHGPGHPAAAEYVESPYAHRQAWLSREGVVYVSTSSREQEDDWAGLTQFARRAEAALREAVSK